MLVLVLDIIHDASYGHVFDNWMECGIFNLHYCHDLVFSGRKMTLKYKCIILSRGHGWWLVEVRQLMPCVVNLWAYLINKNIMFILCTFFWSQVVHSSPFINLFSFPNNDTCSKKFIIGCFGLTFYNTTVSNLKIHFLYFFN